MADNNAHPRDPPSAPESQNKQPTPSEATLQDVLDTLHNSDFFPRTGKDAPSRFWSAYERVAKQHDDEFIERLNGEMDVLLIFAGLFSAVSSAFIVNMQSSLSPTASDTTNALLKILVNKIDNTTFPPEEAALPVWTGPSSTTIWIQTLAYTSLSSSLLAAFGAVLAKQWLGHFKTSRFGRGALHERCERRQRKWDGLESSHFSTILATLPIFLQLSLLFFGIALAGNILTLQRTVASVIMATTAFGLIFYFFTIVSSLKSPDCPFQTPVSTLLQHVLQYLASFRTKVRKTWEGRSKTWGGFLDRLRETSRHAVSIGRGTINRLLMQFGSYHSRLVSALRHNFRSGVTDPEAAGVAEHPEAAGERTEKLDLSILDPPVEIAQSRAIQSCAVRWIIEISTDMDNIAAAAGMVPEIEWTAAEGVTEMLDRLENHFYACFDPTRHILPLAQARAVACLKAIYHCSVEQSLDVPFYVFLSGEVYFSNDRRSFYVASDPNYLVICCMEGPLAKLKMKSLSLSERMWMAHMFTYRLYRGDNDSDFVTFLVDFIDTCLDPGSKPPARLVADCWLLAGMRVGLQIDRRDLARLDKSKAINTLKASVLNLVLGVLLGDIPGRQDIAQKLLPPLLQQFRNAYAGYFDNPMFDDRVIRSFIHLLNKDPIGKDHVQSRNLALLIHTMDNRLTWDRMRSFTVAQFELLMDYHLHICEGTNYHLISATFRILEYGPSNYPDRMRCYIDTIIRFIEEDATYKSALSAASAVRVEIASITQHDESLREDFSKALASAVLLYHRRRTLANNPFEEISFFDFLQDIPYLDILCALAQFPTWHPQLDQNGHFDNCFTIAQRLLSQNDVLVHAHRYAASVAYVFAIIDALGGETHPLFNTVQAYPRWPLILQAWDSIFDIRFSHKSIEGDWRRISREGYLDHLPYLIIYARKESKDSNEPLIALVEEVCCKLEERKQQCEQGDAQHVHDWSLWYTEISGLGNQIRALLGTSLRDP